MVHGSDRGIQVLLPKIISTLQPTHPRVHILTNLLEKSSKS